MFVLKFMDKGQSDLADGLIFKFDVTKIDLHFFQVHKVLNCSALGHSPWRLCTQLSKEVNNFAL